QQTMVARTRDLDSQKSRLEAALTEGENHLTEGLLNALQLRGHETKAHCQRVAAFAIRIAEEMNLKGRILSTIRQGALLHDVGTIGIPDAILLKKESLTPEEWQLMRMHPQIGGSLLEGFENLRGAHTLVMQHHERFDGSGYPMGLRGEQIFIGARIFAVADSLDAILTERSYSEPMALDLAIQRIVGQRGTLHDPKVVDAFAQIAPEEWQEIAARYPEDPKSVKDAA
ncbi:MAG: HD domain-containing protein, partial [Caldilineaceae bacterium]|nr:HD domain-containing protein [Caldilineaceae bacterium]